MKITITPITEEGKKGLNKYFPDTTFFKIKCKINNTIVNHSDNKIIVNKTFSNTDKDKTFVVYIIQDMKKEQQIEVLKDYTIEVNFDE